MPSFGPCMDGTRMKKVFKERAEILGSVERHYTGDCRVHGATLRGVGWNSLESQELRFRQLLKVCDAHGHFSINDYGCGYGSLFNFMTGLDYDFEYLGFDLSEEMIKKARVEFGSYPNCRFIVGGHGGHRADYTVASGIFNLKFNYDDKQLLEHIIATLHDMNGISDKGFSFNCLTKYSDRELMREDLYYGDPGLLFDYCKRNFSRKVALLHDYELYDFTIIVRK